MTADPPRLVACKALREQYRQLEQDLMRQVHEANERVKTSVGKLAIHKAADDGIIAVFALHEHRRAVARWLRGLAEGEVDT